ncbi:MAG TPA: thiol peroxidase [Candidatus Baltobacteraceae bacterium]|jgi:thiol peroxidase|nr:thiol peroxidase [Candidatus Baltobacteraceae bacterium]
MATDMLNERTGVITFKGGPMTLLGPELEVGDHAPEFRLSAQDLSVKTLDDVIGRGANGALLIVVPSLDTGVCSTETHTFNTRLGELPAGMKTFVVSMDLPFAQARWCGNEGNVKFETLSDYRDHSFGLGYGLAIKELGLLARAVVVVGADKTIRYVQIVPEVATEPNYDAALEAAAKAAGER